MLLGLPCRVCREIVPWSEFRTYIAHRAMCCFCYSWATSGSSRSAQVVMETIGNGPGEQSPYIYSAVDVNGKALTIEMDYNVSTRAFTGPVIVTRDQGCLYGTIYIGVGTDGSPNTTTKAFAVPFGTTDVTTSQLSKHGINTIDDALALQITAGP